MEKPKFKLKSNFEPKGSQPDAIKKLVEGLNANNKFQTLLGVTGSGKSLHYDEPILIKTKEGFIKRIRIGQYVDENLNKTKKLGDTKYNTINTGDRIVSFNSKTYEISENQIVEVSKHKSDYIYEIRLDDGSKIKITEDHNCFRFKDFRLDLVKTNELKIGDYLPTTLIFPRPNATIDTINLLEYTKNKVNIFEILKNYKNNNRLIDFFKKNFRSYGWKINQILNSTKERGIHISQAKELIDILRLDKEDCNKLIKIVTKSNCDLDSVIKINQELMIFAGLYLAEGHCTNNYVLISNSDEILQKTCKKYWTSLGCNYYQRNKTDVAYHSKILSKLFLDFGKNAHQKKIPSWIYNVSDDMLAYFLRTYFDGDGWCETSSVHCLSASEQLIYQIKELLLRFEIISRIVRKKKVGKYYYQLNITGKNNILNFKQTIGFSIKYKNKKLKKCIKDTDNTNVNIFPNCNKIFKEIRLKFGLFQSDLARILHCERSYISMVESGIRNLSYKLMIKFLNWLVEKDDSYAYLLNLLNFNYRKIVSIKKIKNEKIYVYDISVKDNENFVSGLGGIFVHNTFTMANVIAKFNRPTLILAHNKTLAAQLYNEFKDFFPDNRVEFFVSYYDYYQPESYLPQKDQYIEKDADINPKIEQMRLSATASLLSRKDTIIISSISCIYSLGNPNNFKNLGFEIKKGENLKRTEFLGHLLDIQFQRNDMNLMPGMFRVKGGTIDLVPGYQNNIIRIEFLGDTIERISELDKVTGNLVEDFSYFHIYPAKHFVITDEEKKKAIVSIKKELNVRLKDLSDLEAHRLKQRTLYDIEMIEETGSCKGIENYSLHFDGRKPGEKAFTLLDYFPDDFLFIIDESHQTLPQARGMYKGDYSRKKTLVDYGFRLPSAIDNRPLKFEELEKYFKNTVFVSATPGDYELNNSSNIVEQIIRPTGLVDPIVKVRPIKGQIDDIKSEIESTLKRGDRVLLTTLTKKLAEELTEYMSAFFKTRYLHSDIDTIERTEIIRELRLGKFDVLVGINLLREGLDIPEVGFIGILDADKEGFLRNTKSLIQIIGRAARNINSKVILYADKMTDSISEALKETSRRRNIQLEYNQTHNITPKTIIKPVKEKEVEVKDVRHIPRSDIPNLIIELETDMKEAAEKLDFETAIMLRDKIKKLNDHINK